MMINLQMKVMHEPKLATYTLVPPTLSTRTMADVFLLLFFLPSGFNVERHVWHGSTSGGAVRHETFGTLPDVPVPKKVRSNSEVDCCWHGVGMNLIVREGIGGIDET
jgi:hypothetical protein